MQRRIGLGVSLPAALLASLALGFVAQGRPALGQGLLSRGYALDNGDANGDLERDLSDAVYLLGHLYLGGPAPAPLALCGGEAAFVLNGDTNGDGSLDVSDPIRLLGWLFSAGHEPAPACGEGSGAGGNPPPRILPPHSSAYGKSLSGWLDAYWRWYLNNSSSTVPVASGPVSFLPIPSGEVVGGDFSPENPGHVRGSIDVALGSGTPFVMPCFAWIAEFYEPSLGIPRDPVIPDSLIQSIVTDTHVAIDGVPILVNFWDFYTSPTAFDPEVNYVEPRSYGAIGAFMWQGVGFAAAPLKPGTHTLTLYERYVVPAGAVAGISPFGVIYDNTWNITVTPPGK